MFGRSHARFAGLAVCASLLGAACGSGPAPTTEARPSSTPVPPGPPASPTLPPAAPTVAASVVARPTLPATATQTAPAPAPTRVTTQTRVTVNATDVIFLAGRSDVAIPTLGTEANDFPIGRCAGVVSETFPAQIGISPGATLQFRAEGKVNFYYGDIADGVGPEGDEEGESDIEALAGISPYAGPQAALLGVFLSAANPRNVEPPPALSFLKDGLGTGFTRLQPQLGQIFFIGDGAPSAGAPTRQNFIAPAGATRVILGFADASSFSGPPGCYDDNVGSVTVDVISPQGLIVSDGSTGSTGGALPGPTTVATPAAIGTARPTAAAASATKPPAAGALPLLARPEELNSYRAIIRARIVDDSSTPEGDTITTTVAYVKSPPARRYTQVNEKGETTVEVIVIGATQWVRLPGAKQWITSTVSAAPASAGQTDADFEQAFQKARDEIATGAPGAIRLVGKETVNGMPAERYAMDFRASIPFPKPIGGITQTQYHVTGDVWIAATAGMPRAVVREVSVTELDNGRTRMTVYSERDVTDINTPIEISPPRN